VYVNGASDSKLALIVVHDIFGYTLPSTRQIADTFSGSGYFVVVPDLIKGDPMTGEVGPELFARLPAWIGTHPPKDVDAALDTVIQSLVKKGYSKIGIGGFCFGGSTSARAVKHPNIGAGVSFHGGAITEETLGDQKAPLLIIHPGDDTLVPMAKIVDTTAAFSKRGVTGKASRIKIFPGQAHGFVNKGDPKDSDVATASAEAVGDALQFFNAHLKGTK